MSSDQLVFTAGGAPSQGLSVTSDGQTLSLSSGDDGIAVMLNGSAATVRLGNGANLTDNTSGSIDTTGGNSQVNIYGARTQLTTGAGSTAGIHGVAGIVNTTDSTVTVDGVGGVAMVNGGSNFITGTKGSQIILENTGPANDTVMGDGLNVVAEAGTSAYVVGTGEMVNEVGAGTNVGVYNTGARTDTVILNNSDESTNVQSNASDPTEGTVDVMAYGTNNYVGLLGGSGYTVNANSSQFVTWDNTSFTASGTGNQISTGNHEAIILEGSGNTLSAGPGNVVVDKGSNDQVSLTDYSILTIDSASSGANDRDGALSVIVDNGSHDTATIGNGSTLMQYGNQDIGYAAPGSSTDVHGYGDQATVDRFGISGGTAVAGRRSVARHRSPGLPSFRKAA